MKPNQTNKPDSSGASAGSRYERRDIEDLGEYYIRHLDAMTREGLHSKSDIAAELAWRDRERDELERRALVSEGIGILQAADVRFWKHRAEIAEAELAAIKHTVVSTIGGTDCEGNPTSEINYLQRLRILVAAEGTVERLLATMRRINTLAAADESDIWSAIESIGEMSHNAMLFPENDAGQATPPSGRPSETNG